MKKFSDLSKRTKWVLGITIFIVIAVVFDLIFWIGYVFGYLIWYIQELFS